MKVEEFQRLRECVIAAGYQNEIVWAESVPPVADAETFATEYVWVVINAGMKNQVAEKIFRRVMAALKQGQRSSSAFGHSSKCAAIDGMWATARPCFEAYKKAENKIEYLKGLAWIGDITKYHLARNLGIDAVKPDRHLVRIAKAEGKEPLDLCKELADATGYRLGTVDVILWRAANLGYV